MSALKKESLAHLFESNEGLHLSVYIPECHSHEEFRRHIYDVLPLGMQHLYTTLDEKQVNSFLAPIVSMAHDKGFFSRLKGSIAIFRTEKSVRILCLPIEVELNCIVADSFHIKPLLKWIQTESDFAICFIEELQASFWRGSNHSLKRISRIDVQSTFLTKKSSTEKKEKTKRVEADDIFDWLLNQMNTTHQVPVFIAAKKSLGQRLKRKLRKFQIDTVLLPTVSPDDSLMSCARIVRDRLFQENQKSLEKAFIQFKVADSSHKTTSILNQIAEAAISGKIKILFVAEDVQIFGKIDKSTGQVQVSYLDADHEDDDLLDDLAQMVLAAGGQVLVVPKTQLPAGRPILAILDQSQVAEPSINKTTQKAVA